MHTTVNNPSPTEQLSDARVLRGEFSYQDEKLSFLCHTKGVPFAEVLKAVTALRDECQRQIDNVYKCPYYVPPRSR